MTPQQTWIAFQALLIKEFLRFIRIWVQTVLPPVITTALYFIIFGNLIGTQIGPIDGHRYIDYLVPGLVLMAVITHAYSNVVSSFFGAKFQRHIEEMLVSPIPNPIIILGFMAGGVARGLTVGFAVIGVSLFFTDLKLYNPWVSLSMMLLTAMLFSLGGLINGVFAKSFDDISIVPTFILTPLTYLGGIFYSVEMLPEFWAHVSRVNPILYMVNAFRFGFLGVTDLSLTLSFTLTMALVAALFMASLMLLNRGVGVRT